MNVDAITLAAVRDELAALVGGRVQHVHLPDELGLALEVYAGGERRWLYCSAHPQRARVHLVAGRPGRASDLVSPLLLLARKYVAGGRLEAVEQPPLERVLRLRFSRRHDDGVSRGSRSADDGVDDAISKVDLVVEVMGRNSNLILVDAAGTVMDAARRVTAEMSRVRPVLPRLRYEPPPPQGKLDPRRVTAASLAGLGVRHPPERPLREALVAEVNACSPLLAREVVFRACGRIDATVAAVADVAGAGWVSLERELHGLWAAAGRGEWTPELAYDGERMVAFAAYALTSYAERRPAASTSAALEAWFGRSLPEPDLDAARKAPLRQALEAALDRLRGKRYSLQQGLVPQVELDRLRGAGEALLAFGSAAPPGARELVPPNGAAPVALDPSLSVVENAQRYFARYAKARTAAREVPAMIETTEHELRYLQEALTLLDLATSPADLAALRAEWAELGYVSRGRQGRSGPSREVREEGRKRQQAHGRGSGRRDVRAPGYDRLSVEGFEVLVGRSGTGNDALTREGAPEDVWLHARGVPGAHVLVRTRGRDVPERVLGRAAALAAARSQARHAPAVGVDYTQRRYVDRIKGAPPGLVTYRGEKTLFVAPEPNGAR